MSGRVSLDTDSGRRYVRSADLVARRLSDFERRTMARPLPPMPSAYRDQVDSMRHSLSPALRRASNYLAGSAIEMDSRINRFVGADQFALVVKVTDRLGDASTWWKKPVWITRNGIYKAWSRDGVKGLGRYVQRAGAGKKGSMVRSRPYLQNGSTASKIIARSSGPLMVLGAGITYKTTYDEYKAGGESEAGAHTVAASAAVGGVGGAVAGAVLGSALGPVGTVVGGAVGGYVGSKVGEGVGNVLKKVKVPKLW